MRKKKAKRTNDRQSALIFALFSVAFLLSIYLVQTTNKLIKVQTANAEAAAQVVLPVAPVNGGSCGT